MPAPARSVHADRGRLVVSCRDGPGIIAAVSRFLADHGANIVHSDQHTTDPDGGDFFLRMVFDLPRLRERIDGLQADFGEIAATFGMATRWALDDDARRVAIFVSGEDHCLLELLWQVQAGDLRAEVAMVISNHAAMNDVARSLGIPFHHVPVTADTKVDAEARQQRLLAEAGVDLVVLARYMQILSPAFIAHWQNRAINIHHSFLPAFAGARPFVQAHDRGVKLIGATAHYANEVLDAGPIIEQDVIRVDHRQEISDLRRLSRAIERAVLARAVGWHLEDRVFVTGQRTVVFS
ncbi:MAG: formyltetrahydrofolate deformylase [Chloroflexota bacterium]|nr:formyltetrahydrofolate deformylase [Chloroflexota bacterium]